MYCPKCGDEINYKSKYCRKCGAKLPYNMEFNKQNLDSSSKVNYSSNKKIIFLAVLGLLVIVLLFSYGFNNHSSLVRESDSSIDDFINNHLASSDDEEVEYTYYPSVGYDLSGDDNSSDFFTQLLGGESHISSGENFSL